MEEIVEESRVEPGEQGEQTEVAPTDPAGDSEAPEPVRTKRRAWLWWGAGAVGVVLLFVGGVWAWTQGPLKGYRAVASVDGGRVTRNELDGHAAFLTKTGRLPVTTPADEAARVALDRVILDDLINRRLLLAEVDRRQITLDPKEEEALAGKPPAPAGEAKPSAPGAPPPAPAATEQDPAIREEVRRQLLVGRLIDKATEGVALSEAEVAKYYQENRQAFVVPGTARLRALVVATREEAEHLHKRIVGGADFAAIVRDHSKGPEADKGGDLGWVDLRMLPPALAEAVQAIPKTGVTPVVAGGDKFFILRVEGRQGERQVPLDEVKEQLRPALLVERKRAKFKEFLAELRKNAKVEIYL
jgi:hypothetical protein